MECRQLTNVQEPLGPEAKTAVALGVREGLILLPHLPSHPAPAPNPTLPHMRVLPFTPAPALSQSQWKAESGEQNDF